MSSQALFSPVAPGSNFAEVGPTGLYVELLTSSIGVAPTNQARIRLNGGNLQVSVSGGAYANIDLGTGITIGEAVTGGTNGSVLFVGSGNLTQDNANFFWDDTNNRLGIGNAAPDSPLHVSGSISPAAAANASVVTFAGTIVEAGSGVHARLTGVSLTAPTVTGGVATVTDTATLYIAGAMTATVTGANYALWVDDGAVRFDTAGTAPALEVRSSGANSYISFFTSTSGTVAATDGAFFGYSSGATDDFYITNREAGSFNIGTSNVTRWNVSASGHLTANLDNTYDIGASGATRPRSIYAGTSFIAPAGFSYLFAGSLTTGINNPGVGQISIVVQNTNALRFNDVTLGTFATNVAITQPVSTGTNLSAFRITPGAHLAMTGESPSITVATVTQEFTGAQALLRAVIFNAPTYGLDGAATVTTAITVDITGTPITGANLAQTNTYALRVNNTASISTAALTTAAGIQVFAPQTASSGTVTNPRAIIAGGSATISFASGATFNYAAIAVPAHTITGNATTAQSIATSSFGAMSLGIVTMATTSAVTTNAATLYIAGAPAATGGSITNAYALWVDAGNVRFDGTLAAYDGSGPTDLGIKFQAGNHGIYWNSTTGVNLVAGGATKLDFAFANINLRAGAAGEADAAVKFIPVALTSGSANAFTITGAAHTGQTASTEANDVLWDFSRTVQFATGALTNQRSVVFDVQTTYSFVGASTITNAIGMHVTVGPTQGTNATFTNIYSVLIGGTAAPAAASTTITSGASAQFNQLRLSGDTVAFTGTTQVTGAGNASLNINGLTFTSNTATLTIDAVASLYISNAPAAGTNVVLTDTYSIWADAGIARFDGNGTHVFQVPTAAAVAPVVTRTIAFKDGATTYYIMCSTAA